MPSPVDSPVIPGSRFGSSIELQFVPTESGTTRLENCFRSGHFHFAKPYWDGRELLVQVVNSTAGIFENDTLTSRYSCEPGARACVLSPSSSHVFKMPGGGKAEANQEIQVREGAALAVLPRWLVPHQGARFTQKTRVCLHRSARLFLLESLSAGRIGSGEFLEFENLSSSIEVHQEGRLLLKEHIQLGRNCNRWAMEHNGRRFPYLATAYIAFPEAASVCEGVLLKAEGFSSSTQAGFSGLTSDFGVMRILGTSSNEICNTLKLVCRLLYEHVPVSLVNNRLF